MNPKALIARVRDATDMPSGGGRMKNTTILSFCNYAKDLIAKRMIQHDQKHFEVYEDVDIVASTQEYDIPYILNDQRITLVERYNSSGEVVQSPVPYRPFQKKEEYRFAACPWSSQRSYYTRARKIGIVPVPNESVTDGLRVYGIQHPHDMLWGDIDSSGLTTTAFVIPETPVSQSGKLRAGTVHTETDYYKNAKVRIVTGSARGVERTITAYNALTRTATIDSAWVIADVQDEEFVILSGIPDEYESAIKGYAIREIGLATQDQVMFRMGTELWGELKGEVIADITPRRMDESQNMQIPDDDLWG